MRNVWFAAAAFLISPPASAQELVANAGKAPDRHTDWIHGDTVLRSQASVTFWIESIFETAQADGANSIFTFYRGDCAAMRIGVIQRRLLFENGEARTEPANSNVELSKPTSETRALLARACSSKPYSLPVNNRRPTSEAMWGDNRNTGPHH